MADIDLTLLPADELDDFAVLAHTLGATPGVEFIDDPEMQDASHGWNTADETAV